MVISWSDKEEFTDWAYGCARVQPKLTRKSYQEDNDCLKSLPKLNLLMGANVRHLNDLSVQTKIFGSGNANLRSIMMQLTQSTYTAFLLTVDKQRVQKMEAS